MSNDQQKAKQPPLLEKLKRELEARSGDKNSPDSVRKEMRRTLEQLAPSSGTTGRDGKTQEVQQQLPPAPPVAGLLQDPHHRASGIFGGTLNSVDIVRHFQSNDSYTVDINSLDSNCTAKQEYVDLIQGIDSDPLPEYTDFDVLPGQGTGNHHPGHQDYLGLISARVHEYKTANNARKTALAQEVIDSVHEYGGRFIQKEENQANERRYTEIQITDNVLLLDKVKNAFRGRLKIIRKQEGKKAEG